MTAFEQIKLERGSAVAIFDVSSSSATSVQALVHTFSINSTEHFSTIELHAGFIQHCVESGSLEAALAVFGAFSQTYGTTASDIHVVIQDLGLDEDAARRVLKGYFSAWPLVNCHDDPLATKPLAPASALFATASLGLMAMFGGQRGTSNYLDEAEWLLDVYRPLLIDFVAHMSAFLHCESQDKRISFVYSKGMDVLNWLNKPNSMPDEQYLLSIPVCLPLVGLIQLMHVMVLYKTLGVSPGDLVKRFKVAVGHSQGIGIAAAFATLTDEQSFFDV
ncbi:beta subunit of fatty acid synthetase, partial [Coemansia furcata]